MKPDIKITKTGSHEYGKFVMNTTQSYGWKSSNPSCSCSFIQPHIMALLKIYKPVSVMDVGCGNGALCYALHKEGYRVTGMEYDKEGYEIARNTYPMIDFVQHSIYDPSPLPRTHHYTHNIAKTYLNGFDCVISTEVIEHLYHPQKLPLFAAQLLKQNGVLIISTLYHGFIKK